MLIKKPSDILSSEITPRQAYLDRRKFMATAGSGVIGLLAAGCVARLTPAGEDVHASGKLTYTKGNFATSEALTPQKDCSAYNNFYEFGTDKGDPAANSGRFKPLPWTVKIDGAVKKPQTLDLDALMKLGGGLEERIYRMRCVEGWSMVIPWVGMPLAALIKRLEPTSKAKYVAFETVFRPEQMPGQKQSILEWPYVEGLRMDEAMNPLTILAVGLYGDPLPNPNGAPLRLVTPWKYGFKGIKSIVRITFVEQQPKTTWNIMAPDEYGFYSNVNPEVDHPRWSQASERRIGEFRKRKTLMFNGYSDQVASMYSGMDLKKNF